MADFHDIIVVGAGTAGMTAALYALRNGKSVLVLESESMGGQIAFSPKVENFPSHKSVSGAELADMMYDQISELGAETELEKALSVTKNGEGNFTVKTEYGDHDGRAVIIATGVRHRNIGVDGEEELIGKGVSYCATCDGPFYAGEEVALIGDGNTALQYAVMLSGYCKKVTVCTLFDRFFGEARLVKTLKSKENVEIVHNVSLQKFVTADGKLSALAFKKTTDGADFVLPTRAVFICVGQIPANEAFADLVKLDDKGFIVAEEDCKTGCDGVFAAGDCRTKKVRQLTTAAADGATAAVNACAYIDAL